MNTLLSTAIEPNRQFEISSEQLIKELSDTNSVWYDLKVTEMSGYDYVFAPDAVCRQVNSLRSLAKFMGNIETILGSIRSRTILISYWHDRYREIHFEKYDLKLENRIPIDWKKTLLDGTPQMDFIRTLYEHSEQLVFED